MITADELAQYFSNLPRDLEIHVGDKVYMANSPVMCIYSDKIASLVDQNTSSITLDISDTKQLFSSVISFLHGQKIDINASNDFYLNEIAEELNIKPLIPILTKSLQAKIDTNNIIPRIEQHINDVPKNYIDFLCEHISEVQTNDSLYKLPPNILLDVSANEKTKFNDSETKYIFKLKCAVSYPDITEKFITDDEFNEIPMSVIQELITNPFYASLDGKLPAFNIISRIVDIITATNTQIIETKQKIQKISEDIQRLAPEIDRIVKEKAYTDERYLEILEQFQEFKKNISQKIQEIKSSSKVLESFKISDKSIDELGSNLNFLTVKRERLKGLSNQLKSIKLIFGQQYDIFNKVYNESKGDIELLQQTLANLKPNTEEIDTIMASLGKLADELNDLNSV